MRPEGWQRWAKIISKKIANARQIAYQKNGGDVESSHLEIVGICVTVDIPRAKTTSGTLHLQRHMSVLI